MPLMASTNHTGGFPQVSKILRTRTAGFVVTAAIVGLTLATAYIHLGLGRWGIRVISAGGGPARSKNGRQGDRKNGKAKGLHRFRFSMETGEPEIRPARGLLRD